MGIHRDFTGEEVADHLAEAIWEHERSPETSIWFSFWDRILEGHDLPEMPINPETEPHTKEQG